MSVFQPGLVRPRLDYPCVPYHELLRHTAQRWPDKWATVFHDQKMTFREIEGLSNGLANGLRDLGRPRATAWRCSPPIAPST